MGQIIQEEKITKTRNSSLDIVRIVALLLVNTVHFFLYSGFYKLTMVSNLIPYLLLRDFCMVCVPLFIILTGYLSYKKEISNGYFFGILKRYVPYVIASVFCLLVKRFYFKYNITIANGFFSILDFSASDYAWYMEMYFGLFLFIPFLNIMYNNIPTRKYKKILIGILFFTCVLPCFINTSDLVNSNFFSNPIKFPNATKLIPAWWIGIYPLLYYFIGAYIREYGIKFKWWGNIKNVAFPLVLMTAYNDARNVGSVFSGGYYQDWSSIFVFVLSCSVFIVLVNINTDNWHKVTKWILKTMSGGCMVAYLVSCVFDIFIYKALNSLSYNFEDKFPMICFTVPFVFVCSMICGVLINESFSVLLKLGKRSRVYKFIISRYN